MYCGGFNGARRCIYIQAQTGIRYISGIGKYIRHWKIRAETEETRKKQEEKGKEQGR